MTTFVSGKDHELDRTGVWCPTGMFAFTVVHWQISCLGNWMSLLVGLSPTGKNLTARTHLIAWILTLSQPENSIYCSGLCTYTSISVGISSSLFSSTIARTRYFLVCINWLMFPRVTFGKVANLSTFIQSYTEAFKNSISKSLSASSAIITQERQILTQHLYGEITRLNLLLDNNSTATGKIKWAKRSICDTKSRK